jgi:hypothetical protein
MEDENGAGERKLVRLSLKFYAPANPTDLRIGLNVIVPPRSVRAARRQHNDGGSSQGFLIRLLHPERSIPLHGGCTSTPPRSNPVLIRCRG